MSFNDYWQQLQKKNPNLQDDGKKLSCSVKELRRILELSYKEGQKHAEGVHRLLAGIFKDAGRG